MNLDAHVAVSLLSLVFVAMGSMLLLFYRSTMAAEKKRVDDIARAMEKNEDARAALAERLRLEELKIARLEGSVEAAKAQVEVLGRDHVPRAEWERAMESIQDQLGGLATRLDRIDRQPGRYSTSDPAMPTQGRRTT